MSTTFHTPINNVSTTVGSAAHWQARLEKLRQGGLLGRYFAARRQRLRDVAERLGLRRVPNLAGCPAS